MVITMPATGQPALQNSRLSRAEALAREIEEQISAGVLSSGDRVGTKDDVRQRFRVAVATVNEAVKLLETRGLVEARPGPGGGVFVASPEARMRSGPMLVGFEWAGAGIRALRSILASMSAHLDQPAAYARYHTAFHRRIASMSPNAPLRSMYVTLLDFFENDLATAGPPGAVHPGNVDVHRQIVDAIEQGEGPELGSAIRRHDSRWLNRGAAEPAAGLPDPSTMIVVTRMHSRVPGGEA